MTPAKNLALRIDRDFYQHGRQDDRSNLKELHAFSTSIPIFGAHNELVFNLGMFRDISRDPKLTPLEFSVEASYEYGSKKVIEVSHIDLNVFRGTAINPEPILEELERIRKVLEEGLARK